MGARSHRRRCTATDRARRAMTAPMSTETCDGGAELRLPAASRAAASCLHPYVLFLLLRFRSRRHNRRNQRILQAREKRLLVARRKMLEGTCHHVDMMCAAAHGAPFGQGVSHSGTVARDTLGRVRGPVGDRVQGAV